MDRKCVWEKTMKETRNTISNTNKTEKKQKEKRIKAEEKPTIPSQNQISFCYIKKLKSSELQLKR